MDASLIGALLVALTGAAAGGSIVLVTVLLASDKGRARAAGYLAGYAGTYLAIGLGVLVTGADAGAWTSGDTGAIGPIVMLVLGSVLVVVGVRSAVRGRSATPPDGRPEAFARFMKVSPLRALGLGAMVSLVNVKNLALFLAAVAVLQAGDLSAGGKLAAAPLIVVVFCLGPAVPLVIDVAAPARSERALSRLRHGVQRFGRPLGTWLPVILGVVFVARGVRGLA